MDNLDLDNLDKLLDLANRHFSTVRTNCKFNKIVDYKIKNGYYIFYAYFRCKKRITIKKVCICPNGTILC